MSDKRPLIAPRDEVASMEGLKSWYNQNDATGFIRLNGLPLRARYFAQGGPKI